MARKPRSSLCVAVVRQHRVPVCPRELSEVETNTNKMVRQHIVAMRTRELVISLVIGGG